MKHWYVVLVTGSRNVGEAARREVQERLCWHHDEARGRDMDLVLIHGACPHPKPGRVSLDSTSGQRRYSVDMVADRFAGDNGWEQRIIMPMSGSDGKPRNERMVAVASLIMLWADAGGNSVAVEAFPPKGRKRSGTRNCIRVAERVGLSVNVTEVE